MRKGGRGSVGKSSVENGKDCARGNVEAIGGERRNESERQERRPAGREKRERQKERRADMREEEEE